MATKNKNKQEKQTDTDHSCTLTHRSRAPTLVPLDSPKQSSLIVYKPSWKHDNCGHSCACLRPSAFPSTKTWAASALGLYGFTRGSPTNQIPPSDLGWVKMKYFKKMPGSLFVILKFCTAEQMFISMPSHKYFVLSLTETSSYVLATAETQYYELYQSRDRKNWFNIHHI